MFPKLSQVTISHIQDIYKILTVHRDTNGIKLFDLVTLSVDSFMGVPIYIFISWRAQSFWLTPAEKVKDIHAPSCILTQSYQTIQILTNEHIAIGKGFSQCNKISSKILKMQ